MFDRIEYLAEAYFHQDFDLLAVTPSGVVMHFRKQESSETVAELVSDIDLALQACGEQELESLWLQRGHASYAPDRDGMTYREWFEKVLDVLREPQS